MENSLTKSNDATLAASSAATQRGAFGEAPPPVWHDLSAPDTLSLRRWWAAYGAYMVLLAVPLVFLVMQEPWHWSAWRQHFQETFKATSPAIKLLTMAVYLSLCTTFLPLPSGWLIVCVATREAAVAGTVWGTTIEVALVGAVASTVANLNDYHLFTWMLRHHRIARLRQSRLHGRAAGWFAKNPFLLLLVFNIVPFPVDVARMLAATCRYPRLPFSAANLLGRVVRYAVFAFVTYWWNLGWIAVAALLALAAVAALGKGLASLVSRVRSKAASA
jgi:membrane protein YqaA with SNARE-associated domain